VGDEVVEKEAELWWQAASRGIDGRESAMRLTCWITSRRSNGVPRCAGFEAGFERGEVAADGGLGEPERAAAGSL